MLPVATGTGRATTTTLRHGQVRKRDEEVDRAFLEGLMMAVGSETRARGISWSDATAGGARVARPAGPQGRDAHLAVG